MNVSEAVDYRRSVRGFLDKPVDIATIKDIVVRASRAASGGNLQPWHVDIVHGESMAKLKQIMADKHAKASTAASKNHFGLRFIQLEPPGTG